jgi:hypothetical protein
VSDDSDSVSPSRIDVVDNSGGCPSLFRVNYSSTSAYARYETARAIFDLDTFLPGMRHISVKFPLMRRLWAGERTFVVTIGWGRLSFVYIVTKKVWSSSGVP